jgi:hypothetical protein
MGGFPISQWCPNGSTTRPSRQPCSSPTAYTFSAPAATARSSAAVRIVDDQQHPDRASADRFGAEVGVRRRLVRDPERRVANRELGHDILVGIGATDSVVDRPERSLVKLDCRAAPHRELRQDARLLCPARVLAAKPAPTAHL